MVLIVVRDGQNCQPRGVIIIRRPGTQNVDITKLQNFFFTLALAVSYFWLTMDASRLCPTAAKDPKPCRS